MTLDDIRKIHKMKAGMLSLSLGEITYYNPQNHTADVQLFVLQSLGQQKGALLREVPIVKGFGGKSFCFSPLQEGDLVILGFCSHPLEDLQKKNPVFVNRSYNHQDAIILGTINMLGSDINQPQEEGFLLGFMSSFLQVKDTGVNIKIGGSTLEIKENTITLGNIKITQDDIMVGNISLKNHVHTPGTFVTPQGNVSGVSGGMQ